LIGAGASDRAHQLEAEETTQESPVFRVFRGYFLCIVLVASLTWFTPPAFTDRRKMKLSIRHPARPVDQTTITKRYTEEEVACIREKKRGPFFLYFAHTFPHVPMFASPAFKGKSSAGIFGGAVEAIGLA